MRAAAALALLAVGAADQPALTASDYRADALALDEQVTAQYAYLDRFPGGAAPASPQLAAAREAVHDRDSLLRYAEDKLASLADHHAITGASFPDDWAIVPTYADLWIVQARGGFRVDAVRPESPAANAGIMAGDRLVAVGAQPVAAAVAAFWAAVGRPGAADADAYAARVLAAGRRDRPRVLTIAGRTGVRTLTLLSLYAAPAPNRPPVACRREGGQATLRLANSLGEQDTIAAFDRCLASLAPGAPIELDLTDTPSGGNTSVARAMMGWFVTEATPYQLHQLPAEERETGIPRQWLEEVLPRPGKHHPGPVTVRVGRWTGSMGEGLAIGLAGIGARVCGGPMAGLRGAVYDVALPKSGLVVKLPAERLYTIGGTPREAWTPPSCRR
ncbi:PDZ domain-containing protein [uncultured Sphingomonas sp.]|uniref:PDZ domain-containing protein n=1 Tax=uncultured Sphingomonas sp. TaxID=158754 RepID=UPI0035CAE540